MNNSALISQFLLFLCALCFVTSMLLMIAALPAYALRYLATYLHDAAKRQEGE